MKYILIIVITAFCQLSHAGSVYKCESANGIVYQSSPCAKGAKKLATACVKGDDYYSSYKSSSSIKFDGEDCTTKARKIADEREAKQKLAMAQANADLAKRDAEWEAKLPPAVGMTKTQAEKSRWGYPDKVNTTTSKYNVSEQWVYRNKGYLYFDNGLLTSIQENN